MTDELEQRLKSHARAFDSLLSLIPAKLYYGEDVSDQWQRKKQTPEQKRAAKMAKLDPDNWKTAKDVMDERAAAALKRKRNDEDDDVGHTSDASNLETSQPMQEEQSQNIKKRKLEKRSGKQGQLETQQPETEEQKKERKALQRAAKRERKQDAKAKAKAKFERQQEKKNKASIENQPTSGSTKTQDDLKLKSPLDLGTPLTTKDSVFDDEAATASSSEDDHAEVFSPPQESGTSSTSSTLPPSEDPIKITAAAAPKSDILSSTSGAEQSPRERLQAAISQLRAERKAGGGDGQTPKTRQELLDQRRRKEEDRKAAKKEQKRREKEEEARRQDEEIARRFSPGGSGSLLASPRSPMIGDNSSSSNINNNFSFGKIAFDDGTQVNPSSSGVLERRTGKATADTASALKAAQTKKSRLAGMDEEKRKEIEQKDMWLNAKRRAHGERVRDDTSLLKKALKRQQGQKKKSEKEWHDRLEGVQKAQEVRQKKRNENLTKRKDEKKSGKGKKVKRPGFEGSFKGRTGGKKRS